MGIITGLPSITKRIDKGTYEDTSVFLEYDEGDANLDALKIIGGLTPATDPFIRTLSYSIKAQDIIDNNWILTKPSPLFTPYWVAQGESPGYGIIQIMIPTMQIRGENGAVDPETEVVNGDHNIRILEDVTLFKKKDFDIGSEVLEGEIYMWDGGLAAVSSATKFSVNGTLNKDIFAADEKVMLSYKRSAVNNAAGFGEYQMMGVNYKAATNTNGSSTIFQAQIDVRRNQWHLIFEYFTQSSNPIAGIFTPSTAGEILIFVTYKEFKVI